MSTAAESNSQATEAEPRYAGPSMDQIIDATLRKMRADSGRAEIHNFNLAIAEEAAAKMLIAMTAQKKIQGNCPMTINAVHLYIKPVEITDRKTGEVTGQYRSVFVDDKGDVWATNSPVVSDVTLGLMENHAARRKFSPPLPIHFSEVPVGGGAAYITAVIEKADVLRLLQK